jgi:hypothetical protein
MLSSSLPAVSWIEVDASRRIFGLAPAGVYRAAHVAMSAVGSYPTVSPLPPEDGGLFSVALSVTDGSRHSCPGVTWQPVHWSPDFPRIGITWIPMRDRPTDCSPKYNGYDELSELPFHGRKNHDDHLTRTRILWFGAVFRPSP